MNRRRLLSTGLAAGLVSACGSTPEPAERKTRTLALVMGSSYPTAPTAKQLPNAINDGADVTAALRALGHTVYPLENPTYAQLSAAFNTLESQVARNTDIIIYFAGHAVQVDKTNYLLLGDFETLVPAIEMVDSLQPRAESVTLILDACRSPPFSGADADAKVAARSITTRAIELSSVQRTAISSATNKGLAEMSIRGRGVKVIFSTDPGNVAYDGDGSGRNSPFTAAFLRHVTQKKSLDEVISAVTKEVSEATAGAQTPWQQGSLDKVIYLAGPPPTELNQGVNRMPVP